MLSNYSLLASSGHLFLDTVANMRRTSVERMIMTPAGPGNWQIVGSLPGKLLVILPFLQGTLVTDQCGVGSERKEKLKICKFNTFQSEIQQISTFNPTYE